MANGTLSQEEINALLNGADLGADDTEEAGAAGAAETGAVDAAGATDTAGAADAGVAEGADKVSASGETSVAGDVNAVGEAAGTEDEAAGAAPATADAGADDSADENQRELTMIEKDALGEIANISMGTAATTLSQLLGKKVEITTPKLDIAPISKIVAEYPLPHVLINVNYQREMQGSNLLVLSRQDGSVIVDLMMGGTGLNPTEQLNDIQISGISEAMNQMMGSAATSMSTVFDSVVDITTPLVHVSDDPEEDFGFIKKTFGEDDPVIRISFRMVVEGIIDSVLLQIIPFPVAESMINKLFRSSEPQKAAPGVQTSAPAAASPPVHQNAAAAQAAPSQAAAAPQMAPQAAAQPQQGNAYAYPPQATAAAQPTMVQSAEFSQLTPGTLPIIPSNLDLIYDVPLQVSVELGRTSKTIREILDLGSGSVVELDRLAGESVDMAVNGKLIAKCEVVVINEMFGIKITEIVSPTERFQAFE